VIADSSYLVKMNPQGNVGSNKTLGMYISGAKETKDGDFILVGLSSDYYTALIMKTDENGDVLWNKTLYTFPWDHSNDLSISSIVVTQTEDTSSLGGEALL
jgi:hypothetical protein